MTRFDIPVLVRNVINKAVEVNAIDAVEVYAMACEYGNNWDDLITDISETTHTMRHYNMKAEVAVCTEVEKYWAERTK